MKLLSIASGSSGNCVAVASDETVVLIDTGISKKRIEEGLNKYDMTLSDVSGIMITHEHSDHVTGLGVVSRKYKIPIYSSFGTINAIKGISSLGKIDEALYNEITADSRFSIGDLDIVPFSISHDAAQPLAYRIYNGTKSVAVATDMGVYDDYTVDNLTGVNALLLEANHDIRMLQTGPYPYQLKQRILGSRGHLSNESSGQLLNRLLHNDLAKVYLGHLSKENNYEELAYETVKLEITFGSEKYKPDDFLIEVAKRDSVSRMMEF